MKDYRQLVKELPSKTVVMAFGRFNPPTVGHELLVKAVKKLAEQKNADHVIYASRSQDAKKNPLSVDKKIKYLNLMFRNTHFAAANEHVRTFIEAAKELNKKYKNIVMVAGGDRVSEFKKILNQYNGKDFNFDTIEVISAGERDPDADDASGMSASKMRALAVKGNYVEFKHGLPLSVRDIDGRRLMNDIRDGMGLESINWGEQIIFVKNELREKYFRGEIFNEGDIVECSGNKYTIVKRGTNHLLLKESTGKLVSKWIHDVKLTREEEQMNEELTDKTLRPNDKIKVARVIATMLGVENAETSSNPENLINLALRKVRTKALNPEALNILDKMLALATSQGINYDASLKPSKLKEDAMQTASDPAACKKDCLSVSPNKRILPFKDFKKLKDEEKIKESEELEDKVIDTTKVGHTLENSDNHSLRHRKVKHHLGEELDEIHAPGTKVRVPHKGKVVPGEVVRHDKGDKHGSPFYVVDVRDKHESPKVPAHQVRTEEVEQIDELSKETLGSYAKKAAHVARSSIGSAHDAEEKMRNVRKVGEKRKWGGWADNYRERSAKRMAGLEKAISRLSKEEAEQIDEVKLVNIMRHPEHGKAYIWHKGGEGGYNYEVEHTKSKKKETHNKSHEDVVASLKKQGYKMHEEVEQIGEATKSYWTGGHLNNGKSTLPSTKTAPPLAPRVELGVAKKINPGDWNKMRDPKSDKRIAAHSNEHMTPDLNKVTRAINKPQDAIEVLVRLRDISKDVRDGNTYTGNLAQEYYDDVWNFYVWSEKKDMVHWSKVTPEDLKLRVIISNAFALRAEAKRLAQEHGSIRHGFLHSNSGADGYFASKVVKVLDPLIDWLKKNLKTLQQEEMNEAVSAAAKLSRAFGELERKRKEAEDHKKKMEEKGREEFEKLGIVKPKPVGEETEVKDEVDEDEIELPELSDDEIEKMVDDLSDDDYLEIYDDDELSIVDDETGEELEPAEEEEKLKESKLMEVLSRIERMKAKARFRRTKAKRERATKIALKRFSNTETVNKRSRRLAIKLMKQRLLRGRNLSKLSVGEKERIEKALKKRKVIVGRIAMRLAPHIRQIEKSRLSHRKFTRAAPNVTF